jgi:hypothetical protein
MYWILHSLRPHAAQIPFKVRKRLVLLLILPHVNYDNIVFTGADSASQRRLGIAFEACLGYIHIRRRLDHFSHLESTVTGTLWVDNVKIQLLSFSSFLSVFSVSFCLIGAHLEFNCSGSSYACYESIYNIKLILSVLLNPKLNMIFNIQKVSNEHPYLLGS